MRLFKSLTTVILGLVLWLPGSAQQTLDRSKTPPPGKTPVLHVPAWTKSRLANGADLIVSEKHDLPLVSLTITFLGGSNQFDPPNRTGMGSLTAAMMSEGTRTRDGDALSNALQLLGTVAQNPRRDLSVPAIYRSAASVQAGTRTI